ncbi:hypothetical protein [Peribacillus simplex]|uniref:hypothetical protein n=1 Tax=Peribacillus simplex TaxID=1478 RepID=UPI000BA5E157|nr:hypothetical protein [Peribacillus simplex]PAK42660.1 hypothetical protein CHI08_08850 [Peribacillus simplex]
MEQSTPTQSIIGMMDRVISSTCGENKWLTHQSTAKCTNQKKLQTNSIEFVCSLKLPNGSLISDRF